MRTTKIDVLGVCLMLLFELVTITLTWLKVVPAVRRTMSRTQGTMMRLSLVVLYDGERFPGVYHEVLTDILPVNRDLAFHVSYRYPYVRIIYTERP